MATPAEPPKVVVATELPAPQALGAAARSAVIWNTGFTLFRDILQFGLMLFLVRLLDRSAYGQFSLVNSVIGFISIFSFNNFLAHTLQVRTEDEACFQEHFTAGAAIQLLAFCTANGAALIFRWFPSYAPVAPYLHVMSIVFLLDWPTQIRVRMLERAFNWKRLRIIHATGLVLNVVAAVVLAVAGAGTYVLLLPGLLVTLPFMVDLFFIQKWRPTWRWSWQAYRPAWRFGITRVGSGSLLTGRQTLEALVLAAVLGYSGFGIFNRAIALAQMFCGRFATLLMSSIYPVLTQLDDEVRVARTGDVILRLVAWAVTPIAMILSLLADPAIRAIYGERWLHVIPLLPWALALGTVTAISHVAYMLLLSRHATKKCLVADVFIFAGTGLALLFIHQGREALYLASLLGVQTVVASGLVIWLWERGAATGSGLAAAFLPPAFAASAGIVLARGVQHFHPGLTRNTIFATTLAGGLLLLYAAVLRFGFKDQLAEIVRYFPGRRHVQQILFLPV